VIFSAPHKLPDQVKRPRGMILSPRGRLSVGPNAPRRDARFSMQSIGRSRNEASRRPFQVYGFESSTTVHQSFGHSARDPHRRLLRGGRMFGVGFDIPSPTVAQLQSWPRRVQTAVGNRDQTLSAAFQAGEPRRACGLAGPSNRTGNNGSLAPAAGRAARRSIHAGAAPQHRPYTQAQTTEGAPSRDGSADVSATADTMYSRVRRFGSPDAVVLDLPRSTAMISGTWQTSAASSPVLPSTESDTRLFSAGGRRHI
jgi:hypothetical protein